MKLLIIIPTYNESENIEALLTAIRLNLPKADILVVDDSSPDRTGEVVKRLSNRDNSINLLTRKTKDGLGRAYVAGFKWALDRDYSRIISMDADFSHDPKNLPDLITQADNNTVVIGSRYIPGGKIVGWARWRYLNSWGANFITRLLLGLKPKDATAGFKCYPRSFIEKLDLDNVIASGYAFQVEMIMRAQKEGFRIIEVPITFVDRRAGESKIAGEMRRSIKVVLELAWQRRGIRQFVKFGMVGLINVFVDWTIYFLLNRLVGLPKLTSKLGSFIAAATNSYYLNRRWTFRSNNRAVAKEFIKFFLVSSVGAALNTSIFWVVSIKIGAPDIIGLFVATILVTIWNFLVNKYWTFRQE